MVIFCVLFSGNSSNKLHLAVQRDYPKAASLPLPPNIDSAESSRFSPLRNRDINGSQIVTHHSNVIDVTLDSSHFSDSKNKSIYEDQHLNCHDKNTPVSLNSVMQTTVPVPFSATFSHLNMPGGEWSQHSKFLSHELCSSHYTNLRQEVRANWNDYGSEPLHQKGTFQNISAINPYLLTLHLARTMLLNQNQIQKRFYSQKSNITDEEKRKPEQIEDDSKKLTQKEKFKIAVKDYGSVIVVFHVGISLVSLGLCYSLVSR